MFNYTIFMEKFTNDYIKCQNYRENDITFICNDNNIEFHRVPKDNTTCIDYYDKYITFVNFPDRVLHSMKKSIERYTLLLNKRNNRVYPFEYIDNKKTDYYIPLSKR